MSSHIISPLVFIDSAHATRSRAPSQTGLGWYIVELEADGKWTASHTIRGTIGRYILLAEAKTACGAVDVNEGIKWKQAHLEGRPLKTRRA